MKILNSDFSPFHYPKVRQHFNDFSNLYRAKNNSFCGDVKRMKHKSPKNSNFHISLEHFSFLVPDEFLSCCSLIVLHFCSVSWLTPYLFFLTHSRVQQLASIFLPIFSSFAFTFPYSLEYFSSNFSDLLLTYLSMSLSNVFLNGPSPASFIVYFRSF